MKHFDFISTICEALLMVGLIVFGVSYAIFALS